MYTLNQQLNRPQSPLNTRERCDTSTPNVDAPQFTGKPINEVLDGIYISLAVARAEQYLREEDPASYREYSKLPFSTGVSIKIVSPTRAKILLKSFRRAEVTDTMACSNLSLSDAIIKYPELLEFV